MNRPKALNARNARLGQVLRDALADPDGDPAVRAVVLTGSGDRAFCAGGSLALLLACDLAVRTRASTFGLPEAIRGLLASGGSLVPLRHLSPDEHGNPALLRIVKSPTRLTFGDGRLGAGMSEIHHRMGDGVPAGLHD